MHNQPVKEKNVRFLEKMTEFLGSEMITKEDFVHAFEQVAKAVEIVRLNLTQKFEQLQSKIDDKAEELESKNSASLSRLEEGVDKKTSKIKQDVEKKLQEIDVRMSQVKDGEDADESSILEAVVAQLPEHREALLDGPDEIRNKLELLTDSERLNMNAIMGLKEELEELRRIRSRAVGGGGTSAIGVQAALGRIIYTETPAGDIDSVNVTYTVNNDIHAIFSLGINGQMIHSGEYTYAGRTLTFTTALPSDLSGTTFEITYT